MLFIPVHFLCIFYPISDVVFSGILISSQIPWRKEKQFMKLHLRTKKMQIQEPNIPPFTNLICQGQEVRHNQIVQKSPSKSRKSNKKHRSYHLYMELKIEFVKYAYMFYTKFCFNFQCCAKGPGSKCHHVHLFLPSLSPPSS